MVTEGSGSSPLLIAFLLIGYICTRNCLSMGQHSMNGDCESKRCNEWQWESTTHHSTWNDRICAVAAEHELATTELAWEEIV